jgi:LCP family protein required for cell wall assembly
MHTHPAQRRRGRLPLLTFTLGTVLGYLLASPQLPRQLGPVLASVIPSSRGLAALLDPLGIHDRRILVMGSDKVGENTDVMFTVQIVDGSTRITQVPRDTYVESEQLGVVKANALYALAGIDTTRAEIGRLLEAPVDRYVKVNLTAVARIAEALGGVEVDVPKRMFYVDNSQGLYIDLVPGRQLLTGEALEGFLRFRHDEAGDLGRMERQRLVLAEVFRKLAQPATIARLPALLQIAGEDIHTDLSPIELSQVMAAMGRTRLRTQQLPGRLYWQDELSYWMPDSNQAHPSGNGEEPPL